MIAALVHGAAADQLRVVIEQRLGAGRWRGGGVVAARQRVEYEHRLGGVVAADACEFRLGRECGHDMPRGAEQAGDAIEQRDGHLPKPWLPPEQCEQVFALLPRRDRVARPADRQHAVAAARVVEAIGDVSGQVVVADRLAGREPAVAEHQERFASLHALDLPGE